ncbi:MAG: vitamin B12 dependent-methionine synthase activation domain-containing protein [Oscillospiraceae bacterium]
MIKINNDSFKNIEIDKEEVLKYLGYKNQYDMDGNLDLICDDCIKIIKKSSKPAFLYSYFDIDKNDSGVLICNTSLTLKGKSIASHLEFCDKIAIFCVTLSNEIDKIIKESKFDVLRQLFLDTSASVYVEQICEQLSQIIKNEIKIKNKDKNKNLFMTKRYGIGYGDLSLSYHQEILTILNAQKRIGVFATSDGILTPRKSVTGIIGFSDKETENAYKACDSCLLRNDCKYFMEGEYCGK